MSGSIRPVHTVCLIAIGGLKLNIIDCYLSSEAPYGKDAEYKKTADCAAVLTATGTTKAIFDVGWLAHMHRHTEIVFLR